MNESKLIVDIEFKKIFCFLWNCVNKMIGIQIIFWMNMNNWVIALMMKLKVPVLCSRVFFFPHNSYICLNKIMSSIHPRQWSNHRKGKEIIFFLWNFHLSYWISTPRSHQIPKVNWIKKNRMSYCYFLFVQRWMVAIHIDTF